MISNEQLQAVLDEYVPEVFQGDFELRAICHSIAAIRHPVRPVEERLYYCSEILMPPDSPEEPPYFMGTAAMLLESCDHRVMWRIAEIEDAVFDRMCSGGEETDPVAEQ